MPPKPPRCDAALPDLELPEPDSDPSETERDVLQALRREWEHLRRYCLPPEVCNHLTPPAFSLSDSRTTWGRWHGAPANEIVLSRRLLFDYSWDSVLEVLRHEMAHQVAEQALGARGETAHGQTFRRACEWLAVSPRAAAGFRPLDERLEAAARNETGDRFLQRIRKLLALAGSPEPHEAQAAAVKARRLALKYNLALVRLADGTQREYFSVSLTDPMSKRPLYLRILAGILAEHYFVHPIWVRHNRPGFRPDSLVLEISGADHNVVLARHVWHFVLGTIEREYRAARRSARGRLEECSFSVGVVDGFRQRLADHGDAGLDKAPENGEPVSVALAVLRQDRALEDYLTRRFPRISHRATRTYAARDPHALNQGHTVGRNLVVNRPIEEGRSRGKQLPKH